MSLNRHRNQLGMRRSSESDCLHPTAWTQEVRARGWAKVEQCRSNCRERRRMPKPRRPGGDPENPDAPREQRHRQAHRHAAFRAAAARPVSLTDDRSAPPTMPRMPARGRRSLGLTARKGRNGTAARADLRTGGGIQCEFVATDERKCAPAPRDARQDIPVSLAHSVRAGTTIPGLASLARASAALRSSVPLRVFKMGA